MIKALAELAVVIGWPLRAVAADRQARLAGAATVFAGLVALFVLDKIFNFQARAADHDAGAADRRHDHRLFTPTEGAIAACVWAMVLGFAWYRTLDWKMFVKVCLDTVETTSTVLFIVAAAASSAGC